MNEKIFDEVEKMSNQTEIKEMIEELVRIDRWSMKIWEMNERQECELFKEMQDRERILKFCIESAGKSLVDLNLNF